MKKIFTLSLAFFFIALPAWGTINTTWYPIDYIDLIGNISTWTPVTYDLQIGAMTDIGGSCLGGDVGVWTSNDGINTDVLTGELTAGSMTSGITGGSTSNWVLETRNYITLSLWCGPSGQMGNITDIVNNYHGRTDYSSLDFYVTDTTPTPTPNPTGTPFPDPCQTASCSYMILTNYQWTVWATGIFFFLLTFFGLIFYYRVNIKSL